MESIFAFREILFRFYFRDDAALSVAWCFKVFKEVAGISKRDVIV